MKLQIFWGGYSLRINDLSNLKNGEVLTTHVRTLSAKTPLVRFHHSFQEVDSLTDSLLPSQKKLLSKSIQISSVLRLPRMKQPSQRPIMKIAQKPSPSTFTRPRLINQRFPQRMMTSDQKVVSSLQPL